MKTTIKLILILFFSVGLIVFVGTGCQTTKGFGKDVEHVGEKIQGH